MLFCEMQKGEECRMYAKDGCLYGFGYEEAAQKDFINYSSMKCAGSRQHKEVVEEGEGERMRG